MAATNGVQQGRVLVLRHVHWLTHGTAQGKPLRGQAARDTCPSQTRLEKDTRETHHPCSREPDRAC